MRCSGRFILAGFVLVAFGGFFHPFPVFSSDADGRIVVAEYKSMLNRQKDLTDMRQRILFIDENLAMPKVLDNDVKKRQQVLDSLLEDIVAYERMCARYNTDVEAFRKRFFSVISSSRFIGLDPCRPLSISWGK